MNCKVFNASARGDLEVQVQKWLKGDEFKNGIVIHSSTQSQCDHKVALVIIYEAKAQGRARGPG